MGLLVDEDALLFRSFFKEMAKLRGITVKYQHPLADKHYSIHTELITSYSDPIDIDIILNEYPKQKTLKRLGWLSEDPEDRPLIAEISTDTPHVQRGSRIIIKGADTEDEKIFRIMEIASNMVYPDSLTVKLAPDFQTKEAPSKDVYVEGNFTYMRESEGEE